MVAPSAHHSGRTKSATRPRTVKVIQKILRSMRQVYSFSKIPFLNQLCRSMAGTGRRAGRPVVECGRRTDQAECGRPGMNPKITAEHLKRRAIVYIRQSSPSQVIHNQEGLCRVACADLRGTNLG